VSPNGPLAVRLRLCPSPHGPELPAAATILATEHESVAPNVTGTNRGGVLRYRVTGSRKPSSSTDGSGSLSPFRSVRLRPGNEVADCLGHRSQPIDVQPEHNQGGRFPIEFSSRAFCVMLGRSCRGLVTDSRCGVTWEAWQAASLWYGRRCSRCCRCRGSCERSHRDREFGGVGAY